MNICIIIRHSIPENPVIAYALRSGDSFILQQLIDRTVGWNE
jgi:hypothetical protein